MYDSNRRFTRVSSRNLNEKCLDTR